MTLIEKLNRRYATKIFNAEKKLSNDQLTTVLEALRLTPSSFGLQPWKFLVIENKDIRNKLLSKSWGQKQVVDASQLIVFCVPLTFTDQNVDRYLELSVQERGGSRTDLKPYEDMMKGFLNSRDAESRYHWMKSQVYIALGTLLTVCASLDIDACPMEGFESDQYDEILGLKEQGLRSVVCACIGFRSELDKYADAKKLRYATDEVFEFIR
jgi:nitroreductase